MQSVKSRIILFIIKNRHLLKGKLKKEVIDGSFSVEKFREEISKSSKKANLMFSEKINN